MFHEIFCDAAELYTEGVFFSLSQSTKLGERKLERLVTVEEGSVNRGNDTTHPSQL